jgi:hypothetical protein
VSFEAAMGSFGYNRPTELTGLRITLRGQVEIELHPVLDLCLPVGPGVAPAGSPRLGVEEPASDEACELDLVTLREYRSERQCPDRLSGLEHEDVGRQWLCLSE